MIVYMDLENLLKEKNISKNKLCEVSAVGKLPLLADRQLYDLLKAIGSHGKGCIPDC